MCVCVCACVCVCVCVCVYVCVCGFVCMYLCTCMYRCVYVILLYVCMFHTLHVCNFGVEEYKGLVPWVPGCINRDPVLV